LASDRAKFLSAHEMLRGEEDDKEGGKQPRKPKKTVEPQAPAEIIFIGGSYSAADRFYTADGLEHPGVEVIAAMAGARADEDLLEEHGLATAVVSAVAVGLLVSWLTFFLRPRLALPGALLSLLTAIILALISGIPLINLLGLVSVAFGILLHQIVESGEDGEKADAEIRQLKTKSSC
jgi:CHASE2 domain-containing sensor protein